MKTYDEQKAFFDEHWPALKAAAESGGGQAVVAYLQGLEDGLQRRVLHLFIRRGLVMGEWSGKNLDVAADVARAGIAEMLQAAAGAEEEKRRRGLTNLANEISFNLSADLANCWPGDQAARSKAHFEAGLKAADDCIRWREELEKGAADLSMAWWAKGMHLLSLEDVGGAAESWARSLAFAEEAAESDQEFSVVLARGYLGLARWIAGAEEGRAMFREALATFSGQLCEEDHKEDARFGIDQLDCVKERYGPDQPAE